MGGWWAVERLGGWNYLQYKMKHNGISGVYEHRVSIFEHLVPDSNAIIFLGNSITEQCEWAEFLNRRDIVNRGISGDMVTGVEKRLGNIIKSQPRQIFLEIGVNDLLKDKPGQILSNYARLVNVLKSKLPTTQLVITSILPVNNKVRNSYTSNEDVVIINQGLRALAKEHQLAYADVYAAVKDQNGNLDARYTLDGTHLNVQGYLKYITIVQPLVLPPL